jgi:hypothetical protein
VDCSALVPELAGKTIIDVAMSQLGQIAIRTSSGEIWTWGPIAWSDGIVYRAPRRWSDSRDPTPSVRLMTGALEYILVTAASGYRFLVPPPNGRIEPPPFQGDLMWNLFSNIASTGGFSTPLAFAAGSFGAAYVDQAGDGWFWLRQGPQGGGAGNFNFPFYVAGLLPNNNFHSLESFWSGSVPNYTLLIEAPFVGVAVTDQLIPEYDFTISFFWLRSTSINRPLQTDFMLTNNTLFFENR